MRFDVLVERSSRGRTRTPFILRLAPGTPERRAVTVRWNSRGPVLQESYVAGGRPVYLEHALPATAFPPGQWVHVDLALVLKGAPTVTLGLDGGRVVEAAPLKAPGWAPAAAEFTFGLAYVEDVSDEWRVRYDDLVLNVGG